MLTKTFYQKQEYQFRLTNIEEQKKQITKYTLRQKQIFNRFKILLLERRIDVDINKETEASIITTMEKYFHKDKKFYPEFNSLRNEYRDGTNQLNSLVRKLKRIQKI